jgi:hypothetical protein
MNRLTIVGFVVVLLLFVGGGVVVWRGSRTPEKPATAAPPSGPTATPSRAKQAAPASVSTPPVALSAAEKAARVERIKRDYDDVRAKVAAEYAAAGTAFPGGLNAFLRQLALLERELHNDYATVLTPRELEDLEMRDTTSGQQVQKLLGDTKATDEQRRAAFRLQREFENAFALTFDIAPATLLKRETERQATQEKIRAAIGDELFSAWLRGEGSDYASFTAFAEKQGLDPSVALGLWRAKNDYTLRRLALTAQAGLTAENTRLAQINLVRDTRAQLLILLGPAGLQAAGPEVVGWLPPSR